MASVQQTCRDPAGRAGATAGATAGAASDGAAGRSGGFFLHGVNLSLHAGSRTLVSGLDFSARSGERWCVIGRNAVGKSSLLRALAGLPGPRLLGERNPLRCALLPQAPADRFALSVREWLALHAGPLSATDEALAQTLIDLDVAHLAGRAVTELSGGERQRVGLAAVAVQQAPLWLLDEPVSFQDPAHQRRVAQWLCRQTQALLLLSAHDMGWVQQVATHVMALLPDGSARCGPADSVLSAALLAEVFGCPWRQVDGRWLAD